MNLQELQNEERELLKLLTDNREKQREIHTEEFLFQHGLKIGDTVEFMDGKEKIVGIFYKIEYNGVKVNYPIVKQFNADGNIGKREKRCWSWGLDTLKIINSA